MKFASVLLLAVLGCGGANSERAGDAAWRDGRWAEAVAAYAKAGASPRVLAKYSDAALRGGMLQEAVQGWTRLGTENPVNAEEAATGLARTAMLADRDAKQAVLASALASLRQIDPDWPPGRLAGHLASAANLSVQEAAEVGLVLLASAPDRESAARALTALARAHAAAGDCPSAIEVYQSAARRFRSTPGDSVLGGLARCELTVGLAALGSSQDVEAEGWFDRAVNHDPVGIAGRRALIGLGDVRLRQGDSVLARVAWQSVVAAQIPPDSLFLIALERLQAISAPIPDTTALVPGRP